MKKKFANRGMPGAFSPMAPSMAASRHQPLKLVQQEKRLAEQQQRQSQQQPLTPKQRQQQSLQQLQQLKQTQQQQLKQTQQQQQTQPTNPANLNGVMGIGSSGATTPTARPSAPELVGWEGLDKTPVYKGQYSENSNSPSLIGRIPEATPQDLAFRQQQEVEKRNAMNMAGGIGSFGATTPTARPSAPASAASSGASWGGTNPTASPQPAAAQPAAAQPASTANWGGAPGSVFRKGGKVKAYAKGGMISSASRRGDGIATKGKTRGRMC